MNISFYMGKGVVIPTSMCLKVDDMFVFYCCEEGDHAHRSFIFTFPFDCPEEKAMAALREIGELMETDYEYFDGDIERCSPNSESYRLFLYTNPEDL